MPTSKECAERFRRHGIRPTFQRTEILRELMDTKAHPAAETVYAKVRQRIPSISLDTVYRALRLFERHGLVMRVTTVNDAARYDADTSCHHHFVCTACASVMDLHVFAENPELAKLPLKLCDIGKIHSMHIELRGLCHKCHKTIGKQATKQIGGHT